MSNTIDVEAPLAIIVRCNECGADLDATQSEIRYPDQGDFALDVAPCDKCLQAARDAGYNERDDEATQ